MKPIPIWQGSMGESGNFLPFLPLDFARYGRTLIGKPVECILRVRRSQRSSSQNKYYWGVVVAMLSEHCGYDVPNEMHEALAMKFLRIEDCPITGSPRRRRTPDTNTAEFQAYVDAVVRFAAELGVVIPAPGETEW